jgi:hypothetical protein
MTRQFPSKSEPIFADEVMVSFTIKKSKDGKNKDAAVRLSFIDSMRKTVISEIVVTPVTADALRQIIGKTMEKLEGVMEGKIERKEETTTYIG